MVPSSPLVYRCNSGTQLKLIFVCGGTQDSAGALALHQYRDPVVWLLQGLKPEGSLSIFSNAVELRHVIERPQRSAAILAAPDNRA